MKEKILIVEDEQSTIDLLCYNLEKKGYSVQIARNGREALDLVQHGLPDLMLLDVMMPELDGWEVCRIMRNIPGSRHLPIIMLSALGQDEDRIRGLDLGADDYLAKPFSLKELLIKVRKQLDRSREARAAREREQAHHTSLGYLVHELKNAMTVIGGFSFLALEQDETLPYFKTIRSSALHAQSLLSDAALLSKLEQGEPLPLADIDIDDVVSEVTEMFEGATGEFNGVILTTSCGSSIVRANATALRQILINLVSNALKYNREGGKVRIAVRETGQGIDISVADEGIGIAADHLPKVFDKFYRVPGSEKVKGAGLGLYIVRSLAQAMGGTIVAASEPGQGSTFTLSLPVGKAANARPTFTSFGR
jgi:two-component system sensor histidine kinase/response regulator